MTDTFTKTTTRSWFARILGSFVGVLIGLLLVPAMLVGLFWNEGRAVTTARSLAEGAGALVAVQAESVDPANDGKLVHVGATVTAASRPSDHAFGVGAEGIRLIREAEMYQWNEKSTSKTETRLGGGEETVTTYSYSKGWSDDAIDSSGFERAAGHENPPMEIAGESFQIPQARLGAFDLGAPVLDRVGDSRPLPLSAKDLPAIEAAYGGSARVAIADGRIYLGRDPGSPRIGDTRISYDLVPLGPLSVIGRQSGSTFAPYPTQAGDELLMVRSGAVPADAMFEDAAADNTILTWALRAVGLVLLAVGFGLVLGPLGVVGDVIPVVGSLVRLGTGIVSVMLAIVTGGAILAAACCRRQTCRNRGRCVAAFDGEGYPECSAGLTRHVADQVTAMMVFAVALVEIDWLGSEPGDKSDR